MSRNNDPLDAAKNMVGPNVVHQLLRANIAFVWRADVAQHAICQDALSNCQAELEEALEDIESLRAELSDEGADEQCCNTCRHFHENTYTCRTEHAPLGCVLNGYSEWDARE